MSDRAQRDTGEPQEKNRLVLLWYRVGQLEQRAIEVENRIRQIEFFAWRVLGAGLVGSVVGGAIVAKLFGG